ncbi:MAG: C1 family peptidase [Mycobacterium sp.]
MRALRELRLKNGARARDPRLGRIAQYDIRNTEFPVRSLLGPNTAERLRSMSWQVPYHLDQGVEGACVQYGIAHEMIASPHRVPLCTVQKLLSGNDLYYGAQKRDPWPGGAYPGADPRYEGTSVLAGMQQAKAFGFYSGYHWAFGEREVAEAVAWNGPVVIGVNWYEDMHEPSLKGRITPTGELLGGHCVLVSALNITTGMYRIRNSWGATWGVQGNCFIARRDLATLLREAGSEACVPVPVDPRTLPT